MKFFSAAVQWLRMTYSLLDCQMRRPLTAEATGRANRCEAKTVHVNFTIFTNSISYQGWSTLMWRHQYITKNCFSIRITPCPKGNAGESLKCIRNLFQRTGESFSTLRQQTGCETRLFSSFLAYIYKKYITQEESFVLIVRFAIKVV